MYKNVIAIGGNGRTYMLDWFEIEYALEDVIEDYEMVNHRISFFQDDRVRWNGLAEIGSKEGVGLELGSGPGNFTPMFHSRLEGFLVCLDFSAKMLTIGRARNVKENIGFIRGVFESLPIRKEIVSIAAVAFALRDSIHKERALIEISQILRVGGILLIVDVGKPNNAIIRSVLSIYIQKMVPIIAGLSAGYGYKNPWSLLFKTYDLLPENKILLEMLRRIIGLASLRELIFGGLIIAIAEKISLAQAVRRT